MEAQINSSILNLFFEASVVVQAVMCLLMLMSVFSWTVIFNKTIGLKITNAKLQKFLRQITDTKVNLTKVFGSAKKGNDIASVLFVKAVSEVNDAKKHNFIQESGFRQQLEGVLLAYSNHEIMKAEKSLGFLATVGSSAVFIGLFGTVWGIMDSFQSISIAKNTSLAVVAPGIAEALLATALGLVAAIPAKIFHNKFMADINRITLATDMLVPFISKHLLNEAKK